MANTVTGEPGLWSTAVPNRSPALVIIAIILFLLATTLFAARIAWRYKSRQRGWDDIMAAAAWAVLLLQTVFEGMAAQRGFGKHEKDIPSTFSTAMMYFYLFWICFMLVATLTKLAFCCLYLRAFSGHRRIRNFVKLITLVIILGGIAFTIGTIWQCVPVQAFWRQSIEGSACIDKTAYFYTHAAFNTAMDLLIYALPIAVLKALQVTRTNKIGLITIFGLGAFVISASIARMAFLREYTRGETDPTWDGMPALAWTCIESNFAMILCCLPALGALGSKIWRRLTNKSAITPETASVHDWYDFSGNNHGQNRGMGHFTNVHASPNTTPLGSAFDLTTSTKPSTTDRWVSKLKDPFQRQSDSSGSSGLTGALRKAYGAPKIELNNLDRPSTNVTDLRKDKQKDLPAWQQTAWHDKYREERNARALAARDARPRWNEGTTSDIADFLRDGPQLPGAARVNEPASDVGKGKQRANDFET